MAERSAPSVSFEDLLAEDEPAHLDAVTEMLMDGWHVDRESALLWLESPYLAAEWYARVAIDEKGTIAGWMAATREHPHGWRAMPLVVRRDLRRRGVGRALIADLSAFVAADGPGTVYAALPGEVRTSITGRPLFPSVLGRVLDVSSPDDHPLAFYRRVGFEVVGVLPDVVGPGTHELLLAKPVRPAD